MQPRVLRSNCLNLIFGIVVFELIQLPFMVFCCSCLRMKRVEFQRWMPQAKNSFGLSSLFPLLALEFLGVPDENGGFDDIFRPLFILGVRYYYIGVGIRLEVCV